MHFEILVEDASGKILLESIMADIIPDENHTCRIISYRGIGSLPKNLGQTSDPSKRILLSELPRLLRGYGKTYHGQSGYAVIVVADVDRKNCTDFKNELLDLLNQCDPAPNTLFRLAIEEMEAWILGDQKAILYAYPDAKDKVLEEYVQDSICGTWEVLADAIHPGGSVVLTGLGFPHTGIAKCNWAENIGPVMDVEKNQSPSFTVFRDGIRRLCLQETEEGT